eukprot:gnl/MRDRNA2_/MRDRNA2_14467_c0_seq1.p1 gnl/MRDRNA2_/MRDRNA2_14467_c0~~gnl/MRDRNA2_/MRDRNA2_14467_c0_seq1.p1  ORF type:complete len:183 (+),score=26.94 gnl/MRDRNA2_/MRDRNA2_14467_c0_seq1:94-642(+)
MSRGTVTRFMEDRGYGFIRPLAGGDALYFHLADIVKGKGSVRDGDDVFYDEKWDPAKNKNRADRVEPTGGYMGVGGKTERSPPRDLEPQKRDGQSAVECPRCKAFKAECSSCARKKQQGVTSNVRSDRGGRNSNERGRRNSSPGRSNRNDSRGRGRRNDSRGRGRRSRSGRGRRSRSRDYRR